MNLDLGWFLLVQSVPEAMEGYLRSDYLTN